MVDADNRHQESSGPFVSFVGRVVQSSIRLNDGSPEGVKPRSILLASGMIRLARSSRAFAKSPKDQTGNPTFVLLCALASSLERAGALSRLQAWPSVTISIA